MIDFRAERPLVAPATSRVPQAINRTAIVTSDREGRRDVALVADRSRVK
jgi:hypothetical protein